MKSKEITRICGIATIRDNDCYISIPRSWNVERVFALLKKNTQMMGRFTSALVSQGNRQLQVGRRKCNKS